MLLVFLYPVFDFCNNNTIATDMKVSDAATIACQIFQSDLIFRLDVPARMLHDIERFWGKRIRERFSRVS